jgi:hypothetical protein
VQNVPGRPGVRFRPGPGAVTVAANTVMVVYTQAESEAFMTVTPTELSQLTPLVFLLLMS